MLHEQGVSYPIPQLITTDSPDKINIKKQTTPRGQSLKDGGEFTFLFNDWPMRIKARNQMKEAFVEESVQGNQLLIAMSS